MYVLIEGRVRIERNGETLAEVLARERNWLAAGHRLGEVQEEGPVFVVYDEIESSFGQALGQQVAIRRGLDDHFVFHQR